MSHKTLLDYQNSHKYSDAQLEQIALGLQTSINVDFYANPKISAYDVNVIRRGLLRGKNMTETRRLALPPKRGEGLDAKRRRRVHQVFLSCTLNTVKIGVASGVGESAVDYTPVTGVGYFVRAFVVLLALLSALTFAWALCLDVEAYHKELTRLERK